MAPSQTPASQAARLVSSPKRKAETGFADKTSEDRNPRCSPAKVPLSVTDGVGFPLTDPPEWSSHLGGVGVVPALLPGRGVC